MLHRIPESSSLKGKTDVGQSHDNKLKPMGGRNLAPGQMNEQSSPLMH